MLFQLGPVTIDSPAGLNALDTSEKFGGDFAVKPVVGAQQPREFVGPKDHAFTLTGEIFPHFFARYGQSTGLNEIEMLRSLANAGQPQILVQGDGRNHGWFLIEDVSKKSSRLDQNAIGRKITWEINLVESPVAAQAAGLLTLLDQLFA